MRKPILTIFYQYNPWQTSIGGIQTVISYFLKYAPDTFEVRLVGTSPDPKRPLNKWSEETYKGRQLKFFPLIFIENDDQRGRIPTTLKYTWALRRHKLESNFMHFHRIEPAIVTRRWKGHKSLFIHNDIQQQMTKAAGKNSILWQNFPWLYYQVERSLIQQFNTIYSCNSNASHFYQRTYPNLANRLTPFRNAVDTSIFQPSSPDQKRQEKVEFCHQRGLPPNTQLLLFAGRLHPQKDPNLLVESIASLKTSKPIHLLMIGEGELAASIAANIKLLGLESKISMLDSLPLEELAKLYRISAAFVLSSAYEGLPMTVLEALACGIPVISTNSGETPNFLTPNSGIIVHERSPQALAAAIDTAVEHPEIFSEADCLAIAQANSAQHVITQVYVHMYQRWIEQQDD